LLHFILLHIKAHGPGADASTNNSDKKGVDKANLYMLIYNGCRTKEPTAAWKSMIA